MPFMVGRGAMRRTVDWLQKGKLLLKDDVRIMTFFFNSGDSFPHHEGLTSFVFWHLPQIKYKNPCLQVVTFQKMTPTPFIKAYLDSEETITIDCDSKSRIDIHDHIQKVLGKSAEQLEAEAQEARALSNPANFGRGCDRHCICTVPGQVPCPGWQPLPKEMTGKWKMKMKQEAM